MSNTENTTSTNPFLKLNLPSSSYYCTKYTGVLAALEKENQMLLDPPVDKEDMERYKLTSTSIAEYIDTQLTELASDITGTSELATVMNLLSLDTELDRKVGIAVRLVLEHHLNLSGLNTIRTITKSICRQNLEKIWFNHVPATLEYKRLLKRVNELTGAIDISLLNTDGDLRLIFIVDNDEAILTLREYGYSVEAVRDDETEISKVTLTFNYN